MVEQLRGPEARRGKSSRRSEMSAEDIQCVGVEVEPWGGLSDQSPITPASFLILLGREAANTLRRCSSSSARSGERMYEYECLREARWPNAS